MIRSSVASPLPLPAPSSPLLLPATDCREDVTEADVPPRKRLCLTAPAPRFEVGESSATAARKLMSSSWIAWAHSKSRSKAMEAQIRALQRDVDQWKWRDIHDSGSGRRTERAARKCTYNDFLKCQPLNFKAHEAVVGLTKWFEKMESVFHISNYTVACQIKFATCTLLGNALTWRMFPEKSDEVKKYVGGLPNMIQGSVMAS
ncbi:hypothetical protein Tco_0090530 [Tanacetum coccineum]